MALPLDHDSPGSEMQDRGYIQGPLELSQTNVVGCDGTPQDRSERTTQPETRTQPQQRSRRRKGPRQAQPKPKFAFISFDAEGNETSGTRKLIRSHCMRGKNTKKRSKPVVQNSTPGGDCDLHGGSPSMTDASHTLSNSDTSSPSNSLSTPHSQTPGSLDGDASIYYPGLEAYRACLPTPQRQANDMYFFKYAEDISGRSKFLLHQLFVSIKETMYPLEWCFETNASRSNFFTYLLHDACYLSACLFISNAMNDFTRAKLWGAGTTGPKTFSPSTQYYKRHTLELLQKHIEDRDKQIDDSTTAVVGSLALASDIADNDNWCKAHVAGLKRMIQLRGGLRHGFNENRELQLKLLRVDLVWCMTTGSKPMFFEGELDWTSHSDGILEIYPMYRTTAPCRCQKLFGGIDPKLLTVFNDMRELANMANMLIDSKTKLPHNIYEDAMLSIQYRILTLEYNIEDGEVLEEALRVGLITFEMTIFLVTPSLENNYGYLKNRLKTCIEQLDIDDPAFADLQLWLLLIGLICLFTAGEPWLAPYARKLMLNREWTQCVDCMKDIMWMDAVHDLPGENVFRIMQAAFA